jgi:RNA polymerase sigma factor (sigma-70 family)
MDVKKQISGIKENDDRVLQYIYTSNFSKIEHFVINNNGTDDDAKDIYQEAFLAVWRNIQMDKFIPANDTALSGYIYQIAKNKWIDQLRAKKGKKTVQMMDTDMPDIAVETSSEDEEDYLSAVKKHFESLGQQCKDLLGMFYYKKQSLREIAAFFSWTEASAKNNKYRCLQRLRNMVIENK